MSKAATQKTDQKLVFKTGYGLIRVHTRQGNQKKFKVRELSGNFMLCRKSECFLKCQGNVREFYNFQFVSNDEKQKMTRAVFLTIWIQAK